MADEVQLQKHRKKVLEFFLQIEALEAAKKSAEGNSNLSALLNIFSSKKKVPASVYGSFQVVKENDTDYLEQLDILPRYGKELSQVVSEPKTLYSPIIDADSEDDYDVKYAFCKNEQGGQDFIYSSELVTKLYTFEDQLFMYNAIWDYSRGCICAEKTEAFFFKDISDMSTLTEYKSVTTTHESPFGVALILFIMWAAIGGIIGGVTGGVTGCVAGAILGLIFAIICYFCNKKEDTESVYRASETFKISASSGNSISTTIVCNEWLEANKATYVKRSDGEKVIQAIRKMIEEKKR